MLDHVPVIDIEPFLHGDSAGKDRVAEQFDRACRDVGFIVITGHGVDAELPEAVFREARAFFDLPYEEKLKVQKEPGASGAGYHPFLTEANDMTQGPDGPEDIRESFGLGRSDRFSGSFNRWPAHPAALQDVCVRYYAMLEGLGGSVA